MIDDEKLAAGKGQRSKAVRLAADHLIMTCATLAAIVLFVVLGSQLVPAAITGLSRPDASGGLEVAFLLNIAIILFGWRRSRDLRDALNAHEEAERAARRNASTDQATGLANRRELMRALGAALHSKRPGVLLLLDLDHFKRVNDLHGHLAGDLLLRSVADLIRGNAPAGSCCARIGGDEFAILLESADPSAAGDLAARLVARLADPVRLGNAQAQISASVGLAAFDGSTTEDAALHKSDVALYAAKKAGRNGFAWFDEELEQQLASRTKLEEDIRLGIERREFVPYFQPLFDLCAGQLVGFEVLARWESPTRGLLEPQSFIEAAETTGLIGPLTLQVMEEALREARKWPANLKVAVNISPVQFRDQTLAEQVLKVLRLTAFPASRLELEITEGSLLEDREQVTRIIQSLKNVGITISLDDFGTGYASLAQLHNLPVDRIKIDKSFINTLVKSDRAAAIVDALARMGHDLNVPITAEGVETEQIRQEISRLGCSEAQGWLFGRAVSAEMVTSFFETSTDVERTDPAAASSTGAEAWLRRSGT